MATHSHAVREKKDVPLVGSIEASLPVRLEKAGPLALSHYLITTGTPITDSGNQTQRLFLNTTIQLGSIDTAKFKVTISNLPDTDAPFAVDDGLSINGNIHPGFAGVKSDPKHSLGQDPGVCYNLVDAIDVTNELRSDGTLFVGALDLGGYVFCCSRLYARVLPK